jgi:hypothetical protein
MENKKELLVWKHKVPLDREILDKLNTFYSADIDESVIGRECFSHPSLGAHECNPEAKLAGNTDCHLCSHIFDRYCPITCQISRFCLMTFAYRLGIGGEDFEGSLKYLSGIRYELLYKKVQQRLADLEQQGPEAPIADGFQLSLEFKKGKPKKIIEKLPEHASKIEENNASKIEEDEAEWITISQAASEYNCSYVNIYSHIKKGNLKSAKIKGVQRVKKADVLSLMKLNGR